MGADSVEWVDASGGDKPKDSVKAGTDNGDKLYVARAEHEGILVPGKLHKGHSCVYIPYGGEEVCKEDYQVLVAPTAALSWVEASDGSVPDHAIPGGCEGDGEQIYIGRAIHDGTVTIGKVHPSHGCCYVAHGGEEHSHKEYEVLCKNALGRFLGL